VSILVTLEIVGIDNQDTKQRGGMKIGIIRSSYLNWLPHVAIYRLPVMEWDMVNTPVDCIDIAWLFWILEIEY